MNCVLHYQSQGVKLASVRLNFMVDKGLSSVYSQEYLSQLNGNANLEFSLHSYMEDSHQTHILTTFKAKQKIACVYKASRLVFEKPLLLGGRNFLIYLIRFKKEVQETIIKMSSTTRYSSELRLLATVCGICGLITLLS